LTQCRLAMVISVSHSAFHQRAFDWLDDVLR
jgi:hypothetical protein